MARFDRPAMISSALPLEPVDRIDIDVQQSGNVVLGLDAFGMAAPGSNEPDFVILSYLSHHHLVDQLAG